MPPQPQVDVNLFVHNGEATVGAAIESVLAQTWPAIRLTLIDDGSTDGTPAILQHYVNSNDNVRLQRSRANAGAIASFQRAFWTGDADFVMPKSGDDVLAPDFIETTLAVLLANPDCAMCHAGGLIFRGDAEIHGLYPPEHRLLATGTDPVARAAHVMARYTSSPSFWGIYRREASDRLAPIRYRGGWDHALLAELALYGEIRHVPEPLYWRRDGGKPVARLARAATEPGSRRLPLDEWAADQRWRTPLITTAYAHIETFMLAQVSPATRQAAVAAVPDAFRSRWLGLLRQEAQALRTALPDLLNALPNDRLRAMAGAGALFDAVRAAEAIVPEAGLLEDWSRLWPAVATPEPASV